MFDLDESDSYSMMFFETKNQKKQVKDREGYNKINNSTTMKISNSTNVNPLTNKLIFNEKTANIKPVVNNLVCDPTSVNRKEPRIKDDPIELVAQISKIPQLIKNRSKSFRNERRIEKKQVKEDKKYESNSKRGKNYIKMMTNIEKKGLNVKSK